MSDVKVKKPDNTWQSIKGDTGPAASLLVTTKGDLLTYSTVPTRFGIGSDGKVLGADASQATGNKWTTTAPNSVANDNNIARFDGTTGLPVPVQDSKLLITDDGAIQSTPTGGDARGSKAVDLQVQRTNSFQVASGAASVVGGGTDNGASGANSVVVGGTQNSASGARSSALSGKLNASSGTESAIAGGNSNVASAQSSFVGAGSSNSSTATNSSVLGGSSNSASAQSSAILGGVNNTASGAASSVLGGDTNTASAANSVACGKQAKADKTGQAAHASGMFGSVGDAQKSVLIWRNATTNATPTELFLDGAALRATVPLNTTWGGEVFVVARSDAGVCAVWRVDFGIQNNANTVSLVAAVITTVIADGTGATWGVAGGVVVSADSTNKSLKILITGAAVTNIRWVATAYFAEVSY